MLWWCYKIVIGNISISCLLTHGSAYIRFLDYMLLSRTNEDYNQMVERRRLDYSRVIKEQHCYVAKNFAVEAGTAGHFQVLPINTTKWFHMSL